MHIYIGSDHAGYELKEKIKLMLDQWKYTYTDFGTDSIQSVDYPDYAFKVATALSEHEQAIGILICGSGIGVDICANKVLGVRSALVYNETVAKLAREHDHANLISLAARYFSDEENIKFLKIFLESHYEGERHERRVNKIIDYEKAHWKD